MSSRSVAHDRRSPRDLSIRAGYYCIDTFTPLSRDAYKASRAAVNVALSGAESLIAGNPLVYSLCRPPGHHAERDTYGGFCYFCNGAIAAQSLIKTFGRVAVLDVDYHHGNGTQDIFYHRSDVLTVSIHGHPSFAYPYFSGFADEVGEGEGKGFNHNLPLPEHVDDARYLSAAASAPSARSSSSPRRWSSRSASTSPRPTPPAPGASPARVSSRSASGSAALRLPTLLVQEGLQHPLPGPKRRKHAHRRLQHGAETGRKTRKRPRAQP